eukprot:7385291-Prymnesium_polylepis.1
MTRSPWVELIGARAFGTGLRGPAGHSSSVELRGGARVGLRAIGRPYHVSGTQSRGAMASGWRRCAPTGWHCSV